MRWSRSNRSYGGSRDTDLVTLAASERAGSIAVNARDSGVVLTDRYDLTDAYTRTAPGSLYDGLYTQAVDGAGSTYGNDQTSTKTFTGGYEPTADTLDSRSTRADKLSVKATDAGTYRTTLAASAGSAGGQTVGVYYAFLGNASAASLDVGARLNRLDGTSSVTSMGSSRSASLAVDADASRFTASDGSGTWTTVAMAASGRKATSGSAMQGDLDAAGAQTTGTLASSAASTSSGQGWTWTQSKGPKYATSTSLQTVSAASSGGSQSNLTFVAGMPTGTVTVGSKSSSAVDLTASLKGPFAITGGRATADNYDHRNTETKSERAMTLSLVLGVGIGSVKAEDTTKVAYDYKVGRTVDMDDDSLHSTASGSGSGTATTSDKVSSTIVGDSDTTTRAFAFTQKDASRSSVKADGKRKDDAGHSGTWTYVAKGSSNVDNRLETTSRLGDGGWAETGRSFTTDKSSEQSDRYHEDDDGLGLPRTPERMTASYGNTLDTTSKSSSSLRAAGTPARYTVNSKLDTQSTRRETHRGSYEKPAVDPTGAVTSEVMRGNSSSEGYTGRILQDTHDGVVANGEANWSVIDTYAWSVANSKSDATEASPWREAERHQRGKSTDEMLVRGSSREGTRERWVKAGSWSWGRTITRSAWGSGITTYGTAGPTAVPERYAYKSWGRGPVSQTFTIDGILAQDFVNDPGVQWLYRNGSDVLRIVGGAIDVGVGLGLTLGTGGLAILPGVGLMAVGIDQIATGVRNIGTGEQRPSLFEFGGYSSARGMGFGEGTAQMIGVMTPMVLSLGFAGLGSTITAAGRAGSGPKTLYVYLTEEQFKAVSEAGRLGRGYEGARPVLWWPWSEGRIWATPYAPEQMKGFFGGIRALFAGITPSSYAKMTRWIEITGEAAAAFKRPWGFEFSWNFLGWSKGILGNQYYHRGTLALTGPGQIASILRPGAYTAGQMWMFRGGEIIRFYGIYTGLPLAGGTALGYTLAQYDW